MSDDEKRDIFNATYADIPIRDQRDTMERPFFSLAKKPRRTPIEYRSKDIYVRVSPNKDYGIATIWDADILIWAATQITEAIDRGQKPSPRVQFHPYALLTGIRRRPSGENYNRLMDALRRLASTFVETNIRVAEGRETEAFTWITSFRSRTDNEGNPLGMSITLPDWLYEGIVKGGGVLSIHEDYFLLTGGIERWLYRVARKHAGKQEHGWSFTMRQLYEKSGSAARFSDFAIDVRKVVSANELPEYVLELNKNEEGAEIVSMVRRSVLSTLDPQFELPRSPRRRVGQGLHQKALRF